MAKWGRVMTTHRTPEQIAEQTVESFEPDDRMSVNPDDLTYTFGYPLLKDMLVAAIEADRAQRLSDLDLLEDLRQIRDQRGDWRGVLDSLIGDES